MLGFKIDVHRVDDGSFNNVMSLNAKSFVACAENDSLMMAKHLEQVAFTDILLADLDTLNEEQLDELSFGVVGMSAGSIVEVYNAAESKLAGLSADTVVGSHYFSHTAQCMNNFMIAQRFEDEPELDTVIDYVLTLRMRPTPVRLRLLKGAAARRRYILFQR